MIKNIDNQREFIKKLDSFFSIYTICSLFFLSGAILDTIRLKFIIPAFISLIVIIASLYIPHVFLYDNNALFSFLHLDTVVENAQHNKGVRKNFSLLQDKELDLGEFINLLYFFSSMDPALIVYDTTNFSFFSDRITTDIMNDFIKNNNKVIATSHSSSMKRMGIIHGNYLNNDLVLNNFVYLQTKNSFNLSNSIGDISLLPATFIIPPYKNSLYTSDCTTGNVDILYKMGKRYAFTLPFLIYLKLSNISQLERLKFEETSVKIGSNTLYYDERGRISFNQKKSINVPVTLTKLSDFGDVLQKRTELIKTLNSLGLIKNKDNSFNSYHDDESVIDTIYNIPEFTNAEKNALLTSAKRLASEWKSFKQIYKNVLGESIVFISKHNEPGWISKTMSDVHILEKTDQLKRVLYIFSFFISIIFFMVCFSIVFYIQSLLSVLLSITVIIINLILYFFAINYLKYDYPVLITIIFCITGTFFGLFYKQLYFMVWYKEVSRVLGHNISNEYKKNIALSYKNKETDFNSGFRIASFMNVDISGILEYEKNDSNFIYDGKVLQGIESLIKSKNGVINSITPSCVSSYFGIPLRTENSEYITNNLDAAKTIVHFFEKDESVTDSLKIAIHVKNEYFDLLQTEDVVRYRNIGSSINVLNGMKVIASRFECKILISASVVKLSAEALKVRMLDRVRIKGHDKVERFFEYLTDKDYKEKEKIIDYFHAGLKLFELKMWDDSSYYFRQCLKLDPEDVPSKIYLKRCKDFMYIAPNEEWDGIYEVE